MSTELLALLGGQLLPALIIVQDLLALLGRKLHEMLITQLLATLEAAAGATDAACVAPYFEVETLRIWVALGPDNFSSTSNNAVPGR
jgi:hypothetical protein